MDLGLTELPHDLIGERTKGLTQPEYREVVPVSKVAATKYLASNDTIVVRNTLVSLALHEPDWRWVQSRCLKSLHHEDGDVRRVAALCLGHLARIHGIIDRDLVLPALYALRDDPFARGGVADALDDIEMFAP